MLVLLIKQVLFFLFIRCANDNGADQHELRNCCWLISAVVVYLLHSTCILPRVSLFEQKNNKALDCPCSRNYLVYVRHGLKQRFFLCRAHVWLGKYTCICYMYKCVFCLLQHRFRAPLSHMFDTPSNACCLLITVIVGKQHRGLCFKLLTHLTTSLHFLTVNCKT